MITSRKVQAQPSDATSSTAAADVVLSRPRRLWRRLATVLLTLAAIVGMVAMNPSSASASGGLTDCIHGIQGGYTAITTALPVNGSAQAGLTEHQWLYRWNGYNWQYTYRAITARSYAGGVWLSGGTMVSSMNFYAYAGSGYYLVLEQIIQPNGSSTTFWQQWVRNVPGGAYTSWCQA